MKSTKENVKGSSSNRSAPGANGKAVPKAALSRVSGGYYTDPVDAKKGKKNSGGEASIGA